MIDAEVFAQHMGLLSDRIGRALAGPTMRAYYEDLSRDLSTAEFVAAARLAFETWKEWRWPSPAELRQMVKPLESPNLVASELFEQVAYLASNTYDREREAKLSKFSGETQRAFRAIGGLEAFADLDRKDRPWLKKRFVEAYEQACVSTLANSMATVALKEADERVKELVSGVATARAIPARTGKKLSPEQP